MPIVDDNKIQSFTTPAELSHWLALNHATQTELWVKIFKINSGITSVNWDDVVIEVLCWGWIDGIKKSIDEHAYLQRITPRKAQSSWSKRNVQHVERLMTQGRMQEAGLIHVRAAQADGRWDNAYSTSEMAVPADFIAELEKHSTAKQFFNTLTKANRFVIAYGLSSAKRATTRQNRFDKYLAMLQREEKPS